VSSNDRIGNTEIVEICGDTVIPRLVELQAGDRSHDVDADRFDADLVNQVSVYQIFYRDVLNGGTEAGQGPRLPRESGPSRRRKDATDL